MNQFRDLLILVLIVTAVGIGLGHPDTWAWPAAGGTYVVTAIDFLAKSRPWSIVILAAVALALFMTRLKY